MQEYDMHDIFAKKTKADSTLRELNALTIKVCISMYEYPNQRVEADRSLLSSEVIIL